MNNWHILICVRVSHLHGVSSSGCVRLCVCVCVCEREIVNQEPTDTGNSVNVCLRAAMGVPELVELHG